MADKVSFGGYEYSNPQPDVYLKTHAPSVCAGQNCCIHNPSDHHMKDWPLVHRTDEGVLVPVDVVGTRAFDGEPVAIMRKFVRSDRVCAHGVAHPDPDSLAWLHTQIASYPWEDHPCDECCIEKGESIV